MGLLTGTAARSNTLPDKSATCAHAHGLVRDRRVKREAERPGARGGGWEGGDKEDKRGLSLIGLDSRCSTSPPLAHWSR